MIRTMIPWLPGLTLHSLAIMVSLLTYILTTRSARERRPPSSAIGWVLGMIALPYVVLPLYLIFGRRKLKRRNATRLADNAPATHWAEELIDSFGLPGASATNVRWHQDGAAARSALFEIFARAQQRLDVGTFILTDDPFGREVSECLIKRAQAGVRVRLMIDGLGALQLPRARLHAMNRAGVETAIFGPLFRGRNSGPRNLRNHRKLVVADEAQLWAGGRNLAIEYFTGESGRRPWRDLSFDLDGPVAIAASRQFEADWRASHGRPAGTLKPNPSASGDAIKRASRAQFLPSGPDQSEDTVHSLLIAACFHAKERVLAVTPYLLPDAALTAAIRLAARRGVRIDLCLPRSSNHVLADFARGRTLCTLAEAGVHFHLLPEMVHAKAVVFDSTLAISGSVNLDSRSLLLNYESAFVFYSAADIEWLADWVTALIAEAEPYVNHAPGLWRDLAEGLLLTVGYQL